MKKLFLFLPVLLLLSFRAPDGEKFDKAGVSFSIPAHWKITDEEDFDGKGHYLACEKEGDNSSGLVTVSWVNAVKDLGATANEYAKAVKENFLLKKANPRMSPARADAFNGIIAQRIDYSVKLLELNHEGHIYAFHGGDKTITVMVQQAVEDDAANEPGIREITESFAVK